MGRPVKQSGFIYFLLSEKHNAVKIGFTRYPIEQRIKFYSTYCPYDYDVLKIIKGSMIDEREIHRRFVKYIIRTEWFHYSDELKEFIEKL